MLKNLLTSSYLTRTILSFCLFVVLIIGIIGGLLINKSNQLLVDEVSRESRYKLESIRDYIEQVLLKQFEYSSLNKVMTTVNSNDPKTNKLEEDLLYFIHRPVRDNLLQVSRLNTYLRSITLFNDGIINATLKYKDQDLAIDSRYFYQEFQYSPDAAFISDLHQTEPYTWRFRDLGDGSKVATYVYTLPYKSAGDQVKGYLYIDVDTAVLMSHILSMVNTSTDKLFIYDHTGELILSSVTGKAIEDPSLVISRIQGGPSEREWSYELHRTMGSYQLISAKLKKDVLMICLIVLLLGLLISIGWSLKIYAPVKSLLKTIRGQFGESLQGKAKNEYKMIEFAINTMDHKIHSLNQKLREKLIGHILFGNLNELDDIPIQLDAYYKVAVMMVKDGAAPLLSSRELRVGGVQVESVSLNAQEIALLYRLDVPEKQEEMISQHLHELCKERQVSIGVGETVDAIENIQFSYRQAQQAAKFSFVFGNNRVILFENISHRDVFPLEVNYSHFEHILLAGDREGIGQFLEDFRKTSAAEPYTIEAIEVALLQVLTLVMRVAISYQLEEIYTDIKAAYQDVRSMTLEELLQLVEQKCQRIANHILESKKDSHTEMMEQIIAYIENHLDEDISLDRLADEVYMSVSYISKLFKKTLNTSFSDYILQVRMDKAGTMLQETSLTVTEIAEKVGYSNSQYFCNRFKKHFGITPSQYRSSNTPFAALTKSHVG